jgi:hypothetical protein
MNSWLSRDVPKTYSAMPFTTKDRATGKRIARAFQLWIKFEST